MNQRRGLKRLTRRLRGHLCHSQFAEFIVNQWQKFLSRLWVPLLDAIEDLRHVAHETEGYQNRTGCTSPKRIGLVRESARQFKQVLSKAEPNGRLFVLTSTTGFCIYRWQA